MRLKCLVSRSAKAETATEKVFGKAPFDDRVLCRVRGPRTMRAEFGVVRCNAMRVRFVLLVWAALGKRRGVPHLQLRLKHEIRRHP